MSAVLQPGERDPVGLPAQVVAGPPPGDHDQRVDPAELSGERLGQQPLPRCAPVLGIGSGAPHQGVVRGRRAGHVHPVDVRVVGQVRAHLGPALDDGQPAGVDELDEHPLQRRAQVGVDRVQLHHDRAAAAEQQCQGVHPRQAVDVPGRQQQGDARVGELPGRQGLPGCRDLSDRGSRLQADPARVAQEQQPVRARRREHVHRDPAPSVLAHGTGRHEPLLAGQPGQGRLPPPDQQGKPKRHPDIPDPEAVRIQALGHSASPQPSPAPRHRPGGAADAPTRPSPPPAGRPTTAALPEPCPRRHPAPQHQPSRPSRSPSCDHPSVLARAPCPGCSTSHATPGTAAPVGANVPDDGAPHRPPVAHVGHEDRPPTTGRDARSDQSTSR